MDGNLENLSLRGYYLALPERIAPKQQLLEEIQRGCEKVDGRGITLTTARNWVLYNKRPKNPKYVKVISEITGIKEENLWKD